VFQRCALYLRKIYLFFEGFKYSIGAGFSAALAATFGKLAMNEIFLRRWLQNAFIPEGAFFNTVCSFFKAANFFQTTNFFCLSSEHD
jgi:hypothetical protein